MSTNVCALSHPAAARAARHAVKVLHGKITDSRDTACARLLSTPLWRSQSHLVRETYRFAFLTAWDELDRGVSA